MKEIFNAQLRSDIVDIILQDHKPLKDLIKILKHEKGDEVEKQEAFIKFAPLLLSHAKPEEESLYVFLKNDKELVIKGMEGDTEHSLALQLVDEIYDTSDKNLWSAKVKVLAELVEHHIKEEEGTMFPELKKSSTQEERNSLGQEYLNIKNQMTNTHMFNYNTEMDNSIQAH